MQFETKIQVGVQEGSGGVQGFSEFTLLYKPEMQVEYAEMYGHRVDGHENAVLYHQPDQGTPVPIRVDLQNKWIYIEVAVMGQTASAVIASVAKLKRLVRQAMREGSETVRLAITPQAPSITTYYNILQGYVDDSGAYYQDGATATGEIAPNVVLVLECEPSGYGDSFWMRNDLYSSPHFIEDSNGDGLADGVVKIGTPTTSLETLFYLTGGVSQQVETDAFSTQGIRSDVVPGALEIPLDPTLFVIMVDIGVPDSYPCDPITIAATNGSGGSGSTKLFNPANPSGYDDTWVGVNDVRWYRYSISHAIFIAPDCRIEVTRLSSHATQSSFFLVDKWYLRVGSDQIPSGWCSSSALKGRYDPTDVSVATRQQINYMDTWGIPGDLPASVQHLVKASSITPTDGVRSLHIAGFANKKYPVAQTKHWWDSSELTYTAFLAWTTVVDASRAGGSYTVSGADGGGITPVTFSIPLKDIFSRYRAFNQYPHRIFAICRASTAIMRITNATTHVNGTLVLDEALIDQKWHFADIGTYIPATDMSGMFEATGSTDALTWQVEMSAGSVFHLDAIECLPVDDNGVVIAPLPTGGVWTTASGNSWLLDSGRKESVIKEQSRYGVYLSDVPEIIPGEIENRFLYNTYAPVQAPFSSDGHYLTDEFEVTLVVTPRTSHLLGID